jgi:hypothetical protein
MATHEFRAVADAGTDQGLHDTYARLAPKNRIWQAIGRAGRPMVAACGLVYAGARPTATKSPA